MHGLEGVRDDVGGWKKTFAAGIPGWSAGRFSVCTDRGGPFAEAGKRPAAPTASLESQTDSDAHTSWEGSDRRHPHHFESDNGAGVRGRS